MIQPIPAQPQENSAQVQEVLRQHHDMTRSLIESSETVTAEEEKCALAKIERFNEVKTCINSDMETIQQKLNQVEQKIKVNIRSEQRPDGVLTKTEQDYADCLRV